MDMSNAHATNDMDADAADAVEPDVFQQLSQGDGGFDDDNCLRDCRE